MHETRMWPSKAKTHFRSQTMMSTAARASISQDYWGA